MTPDVQMKWVSMKDGRVRDAHKGDVVLEGFELVEPPRLIGRFDCRGNYVLDKESK